ncbi:uncharacterized protein LOC133202457 [Saccostrea echinata]|uniref:uncharacterized protein LOC133202457 n=1 Tax=Saccostrea echinata TaxID=191078 RepID=UPI002A81838B|nr:uncharacterized protein LOC133202457 [Saccostrea echinata]
MGCVNIIFLIVLIFKLTLGEFCLRTLETVRNVSSCPIDKEEWEAASKRMNCSKIKMTRNCEHAVYHCLPAVNKTMVEVCTVPKNLSGYCPHFYSDTPYVRNDYKRDCSKNNTCPPFYSSKDAYNYSACYEGTSISTTTTVTTSEVFIVTSTVTPATVSPTTATKDLRKPAEVTDDRKEKSDDTWMKILFPLIFAVLLIIILIAYIYAVVNEQKRTRVPWMQAVHHVNQGISEVFCRCCKRKANEGACEVDPEKCKDQVEIPLLNGNDHKENNEDNGAINLNLTDRTPEKDPQTLENITIIEQSNYTKDDKSQISFCTRDSITDTPDSTSAVPENRTPINQEKTIPQICNSDPMPDPISEHDDAKAAGTTNPNHNGKTQVDDPNTPESSTTEHSKFSKNGISHINSSTKDTSTECSQEISAVPENPTLSTVPISVHDAKVSGTTNPNHNGKTQVDDPNTPESSTTEHSKFSKNGISHINSSTKDTSTECSQEISAVPENPTLSTVPISVHDAKVSGTTNPNHNGRTQVDDPNTPESSTTEHSKFFKNGISHINSSTKDTSTECSQEISAVPENPTLSTVPISVHDAKVSGEELHQREQNQKENSEEVLISPYLCSEESRPDTSNKDPLNLLLDLDVSGGSDNLMNVKSNMQEQSCEDPNKYYGKKRTRKRRGTRPIESEDVQAKGDSEIPERNIAKLEKGLDEADRRIYDLLKEQYKLTGCVRYLEIKLTCINKLQSELEMEFCEEEYKTVCEKSKKDKYIRDRVSYLEKAYSCVLGRIKDIELIVLPNQSQEETSAKTSPETLNPGDGADDHGACGSNLTSKVCKIEDMLCKTEERLKKLYEEGYGKVGQWKACYAKMQGLECAVNQLEIEYGLQVTNFTTDDEKAINSMDKAPKRLEKIFRQLEEIDPYILK